MQIDDLIPSSSTSGYPVSQPDDPYIADLLLLADGRLVFYVKAELHYQGSGELLNGCVVRICLRAS